MKTTASACGKVILFGEHAVVYNSPAIAAPVISVHANVSIAESEKFILDARNYSREINLSKEHLEKSDSLFASQETIFSTLKHFKLGKRQKIRIIIDSEIPIEAGLGSGAAVAIAIIRAISVHFKKKISNNDLYDLAFKTEELHHGTPSGVDPTVIINEKPVFFKKDPKTLELLTLKNPIQLVIADTGVQSKTSEVVADVKKNNHDEEFAEIRILTEQARDLIESGEVLRLGPLMDDNHELLKTIGVSSPELDKLVDAAREAGAIGAKLSGAGRGGHIIALADENSKAIGNALMDAGAHRVFYTEIK
jgi:mevalonate kinase|tara:strand:+ start:2019 stop:2939 length:921 start_codon:yes stop_codon:yes gene_type:complete